MMGLTKKEAPCPLGVVVNSKTRAPAAAAAATPSPTQRSRFWESAQLEGIMASSQRRVARSSATHKEESAFWLASLPLVMRPAAEYLMMPGRRRKK